MSTFFRVTGGALSALLVVVPGLLSAQNATRKLVKPEAEYAEPFSAIAAIRELRDGRVMVSDSRDKLVQLIDLKAQKAVKVGREGSGPGEYGLPTQLFALPGDSTAIFDPLNSRFLTVLPNGNPGPTFRIEDEPPPPPAGGGPVIRGGMMTMGMPRGVDGQGRLYFEGSPLVIGPNGPMAADSAPIMRYDRKTKRTDTLTFLQLPKDAASVQSSGSGNQRNMTVRIGGRSPFPTRDGWAVLPGGGVAVVRARDYHVEIITARGAVTRGPAVPFTPVRVGEAEKQEYRDAQRNAPVVAINRTNDNGNIQTSSGPLPAAEEPTTWPAQKPPFPSTGVLTSPKGEVWVLRSRAAKDEVPTYDLFSSTGRRTGTIALPTKTRVIGFGTNGAIYTIRLDEDDLQYLQRFRG